MPISFGKKQPENQTQSRTVLNSDLTGDIQIEKNHISLCPGHAP